MPTNYTPLANGQEASAAVFNAPLEQLDTAIETTRQGGDVAPIRVSGSATLPVVSSDLLAITTLYAHPYGGNTIKVYDGSNWRDHIFNSAMSLSLSGLAANSNYDLFINWNSGTPILDYLVWASNTVRGTNLETYQGRRVLSGQRNRRFLCTFRTTGTIGQVEDSITRRFIWNNFNRRRKHFRIVSGSSHAYTSATPRSWNADNALRFEFVSGIDAEELLEPFVSGSVIFGASNGNVQIGAGYDTASAFSLDTDSQVHANGTYAQLVAHGQLQVTQGYHYLQAIEQGAATSPTFATIRMTGSMGF